jgi:hypothetical protein
MRMTDELVIPPVAAPFNPLTIFVPIWGPDPKPNEDQTSAQSASSQRVLRRVISDSGAELQKPLTLAVSAHCPAGNFPSN